MGFKVGQKVVYPNHGIGTIEQIEQKQIGPTLLPFYTLRLAANNSVVLVPVSNASEVGLRSPISSGECDMLFKALADDFSSPANDCAIIHVSGREMFSVGYTLRNGRSGNVMMLIEKEAGKAVTTRNWNTIAKIAGMLGDER